MTSGRVVFCGFRNVSSFLQKTPCSRSQTFKPHLYSSINNFSSLQLNASKKFSSIPHPSQQQAEDDLYKKIVIELKGHDLRVLKSYSAFVHMAAACLQIDECKTYRPPKIIDKLTLNKSTHVFKKHRVQYETRTHFFTFEFFHLTGSTASVFLEYIERNLPEGMAMKVSKHQLKELPEHIRCRPSDGEDESPAEADQTQVNGELYETLIQEQCSEENFTELSEGTHSESEPDREAEITGDETIQAAQQTGQEEQRDKASQPPGQTEEEEVLKAGEDTKELDETENLVDTIRSPTDSKDSSSSESDSKLDSDSDTDSDSESMTDSDSDSGSGYDSDSDSESGSDTNLESESNSIAGSESNSKPESDSILDSESDLGVDSDTGRPKVS